MKRICDSVSRGLTLGMAVSLAIHVSSGAVAAELTNVQTVFLIVMENVSWSAIKGNAAAPYINNTLLPMSSRCEQYYSPPGVASSLPDYLWLEGGTNYGITGSPEPTAARIRNTNHLTAVLENAGVSWKGYFENISGTNCPVSSSGLYAAFHNPFVYFDDVTTNTGHCLSHIRPYSELAGDLGSNTVARYNFIVPNLCNDMHNANDSRCASPDRIATGDLWLSSEIPRIVNSPAYTNRGAIFITWDESTLPPGPVPIGMIVVSSLAKGGGYASTNQFTHASTLRTVQEIFDVSPYLFGAANAADLSDLFRTNAPVNNLRLISPAMLPGDGFQFTLCGLTVGSTNVVEVSADLLSWSALNTNIANTATLTVTVPAATDSVKFYRFFERR